MKFLEIKKFENVYSFENNLIFLIVSNDLKKENEKGSRENLGKVFDKCQILSIDFHQLRIVKM